MPIRSPLRPPILVCLLILTVAARGQSDVPKAPAPDVVTFTNGDKLTGKLLRSEGANLFFHSDMTGDLKIPLSKVRDLSSSTEFVALANGKLGTNARLAAGAVAISNGQLTLAQGGKQTSIPEKNLGFLVNSTLYEREIAHTPNLRQGWTGTVTGGFTLVRATQSSTTFTVALNLARAVPDVDWLPKRHRTLINVTETYGTDNTPVIPQTVPPSPSISVETNIFHADGERDQYLSTRFFGFGDVAVDHNFAQGLQLQQVYGAGAGWTPIQDSNQHLDFKADIHFERQQFVLASDNETLIGSTFAENYMRTLPRKIVFTEFANILPAWNNTNAYSANASLGVAAPLFNRLSLSLSGTDNYLNNAAVGFRHNSVQFVTGATYSFK